MSTNRDKYNKGNTIQISWKIGSSDSEYPSYRLHIKQTNPWKWDPFYQKQLIAAKEYKWTRKESGTVSVKATVAASFRAELIQRWSSSGDDVLASATFTVVNPTARPSAGPTARWPRKRRSRSRRPFSSQNTIVSLNPG